MRIKTPREKKLLILKTALRWTLYYVLIFFGFIFMTSGTFMKPVVLIPLALCISVSNNRLASAVTGAVCGFLIDMSCGKLFGYNAVVLTFFCILLSLLFELYLRHRFLNILITVGISAFILGRLDYKFYYEIWKYDDVEVIYTTVTLPVWVYTVISTVFVYLIISLINHFLMPKEHLTLEEAIRTNDRNGGDLR